MSQKDSNILDLLKGNLVKGDKDFELTDEECIGFYFSAMWCPPCRGFTPKLVSFYNKVKCQGEKFEIIFMSGDFDEETFHEYYAEMPWAALKFDLSSIKDTISEKFNIIGIPNLVIVDKAGNLITTNGRGAVLKQFGETVSLTWT
ncbi:nucleoredoxin-like [Dreissena polymorpha]|uniref:Thioredoxin-like fold domain-containing protein n=1 Tax=Dreissena polymorpha TaxID=45954 RepID=A0A9D4RCQ3_DREPO|nr:nucleoredoxin-like [Dreissena polymorpha]XP_052262096.1 nucleoredoxin-like [Dreissena polymorpha]KAH3861540.1 hypothetical protein DPMN_024472 [Dreissena polymorpha]